MAKKKFSELTTFGPTAEAMGELIDIQRTVVDVSSADCLASFTTPKQIVAAPGAGKYIDFRRAVMEFDAGATPYAITDDLFLVYADGLNDNAAVGAFNDILVSAADAVAVSENVSGGIVLLRSLVENKAVMLQSAGADPTAGNGTARLIVDYVVRTWGA